jgi:predicted Zn-dependent peptidase
VGLLVGAGSRDEDFAHRGATLLLQNLSFKATSNRSSLRLNRDMELAGVVSSCSVGREQVGAEFASSPTAAAVLPLMLTQLPIFLAHSTHQTFYSAQCLSNTVDVAVGALAETTGSPALASWEVKDAKVGLTLWVKYSPVALSRSV